MRPREALKTITPRIARETLLVFRRRSLWQKAGVIFIHIPKNAGSSINDALYGQFMGHIPAQRIRQLTPKTFTNLPSFALLRDPVARCRSAYEFAKAGTGVGDGVIAGMNRPDQYAIPEFDSFERFVAEWLPRQDLTKADPVFRPQSSYICDPNAHVIVDRLGSVEGLADIEGWLSDILGKSIAIGHTNRTPVQGQRTKPGPETETAIRQIYKTDYAVSERANLAY